MYATEKECISKTHHLTYCTAISGQKGTFVLTTMKLQVRDDMAKIGVEPYEDTIAPKYLKGRGNCTSQEPF